MIRSHPAAPRPLVVRLIGIALLTLSAAAHPAEGTSPQGASPMHARGTFEVKIRPLALDGPAVDERLGRMAIEKQFTGDLVATGLGQMLTAMTATPGSAAYTAVERVSGTLAGRSGSFALVHRGVMSGEGMELLVTIVPDSGDGDLAGIAGKLKIEVAGGVHSYELEYTLPGKP